MSKFFQQIWKILIIYSLNCWKIYCQSSIERQLSEQNITYTKTINNIIIDNQLFQQNLTLILTDENIDERVYFQNMYWLIFDTIQFLNTSITNFKKDQDGFLNFINIQQQIIIKSLKIDQLQLTNITLIKTQSSRNMNITEVEFLKSEMSMDDRNLGFFEFKDTFWVVIDKFMIDQLSINTALIKTDTIKRLDLSNVQITESVLMSPLLNLTNSYVNGFSIDKATLYQMKTSFIILHKGENYLEQMNIPDERISKRVYQQNEDNLQKKYQLDGESVLFNYDQLSFINVFASTWINITDSYYNFESMLMRFITFQQGGTINFMRSELRNMRSLDNGGCILFNSASVNSVFDLQHTILHNCRSVNYGGAIFGGRSTYHSTIQNTTVSSCKSNIGGGFFLLKDSDEVKTIIFKDNEALAYPNYFYCKQFSSFDNCGLFSFNSIYELNRDLQNTTYYLIEKEVIHFNKTDIQGTKQYVSSRFQRGFIYLIKLDIMENNQPVIIPEDINFNNMYQYVNSDFQSFYLPLEIQGINYPYLMTQYHEKLSCGTYLYSTLYWIQILQEQGVANFEQGCFNVQNDCLQGQQLYLSTTYSETLPLCSYCTEGQFSYDNSTRCETCQNTLFDRCYVNNTQVKQSFWREKYSNEFDQIYECTLSQKNCQGQNRVGVANDLCTEGYVGVMCLSCDVHAEFWGTPYGSNGAYNCISCSSLKNNILVIYILLIFFIFLLTLTLQTNFRRMKNQIYRKYLSQLGIIYIGSSFVSQSLGSVYLKLLIFNFQIYSATRIFTQPQQPSSLTTFENLIPSFLNPTNVFGYSFDCFLINYQSESSQQGNDNMENSYYIGEIKLVITVLIPIIMSSFVLVLLLVLTLLKQFRRRYILPVLFHAYFYLTIFQIQPQLIQYSIESLQFIELPKSDEKCFNLFDPSISCSNTQVLTKMKILSILSLIFYTTLTPIIAVIVVIILKKKSHTVMFRFTLGFLTDEYKTKYYYWEFIRIFLLISLSILISLLKSQPMIMGLIYLSILTVYLYQIHLWHPYQQHKLNLIEQKSIVVSMVYFLASLCYNINNENEDTQILSQFGSSLTEILYYSAKTCQFLFIIWIAMLIFVSYFQLTLRKLQRFNIINRLSSVFPYILTKIYSKRLIENMRNFRKQVRLFKYVEYQCVLKDVEIECSEQSMPIQNTLSQTNNLN